MGERVPARLQPAHGLANWRSRLKIERERGALKVQKGSSTGTLAAAAELRAGEIVRVRVRYKIQPRRHMPDSESQTHVALWLLLALRAARCYSREQQAGRTSARFSFLVSFFVEMQHEERRNIHSINKTERHSNTTR